MTYRVLGLILSFVLSVKCFAIESFTIYLTRHAEKQPSVQDNNPSLSHCGNVRAQQLASLLSRAKIKNIYSTDYQRTMQTALPTARAQKKSIKYYNPKHLDQLATQLKLAKKNSLVVGHSNTTPQLAALLANKEVASIDESNYRILYQIQFFNDDIVLTELTQPLECRLNPTR